MQEKGDDKRLEEILEMIAKLASLDFSTELPISEKHDMIDAIALGLNMLGEELNTQVVARAQLDELNEKLEKFAYTTAHDLKSPLNSQSGLLNLLEYSIDLNTHPEVREIVDKIKSMNEKMKNLVLGILEYSRSNTRQLSLEPVDFHEALEEVLEVDGVLKKAKVEVNGRLPKVLLTKTASIQILRNLIENAIKYNDKDKCVIWVDGKKSGEFVEFSIKDNGPGISPEFHQQIFNVFDQANQKNKKGGLGIGLATVKNIIDAAGGKISIVSEPGKGANFLFTLKTPS